MTILLVLIRFSPHAGSATDRIISVHIIFCENTKNCRINKSCDSFSIGGCKGIFEYYFGKKPSFAEILPGSRNDCFNKCLFLIDRAPDALFTRPKH